jgi:hypothetical protein
MFFCTIMNIFITLFENVNKSCTGAGRLSLSVMPYHCLMTPSRFLYWVGSALYNHAKTVVRLFLARRSSMVVWVSRILGWV